MASEKLPVQMACRVLGVAESGYYEHRSRPTSARAVRHVWLTDQIQAVHAASFGTHGSRLVHAELRLGLGIAVGHGSVEMLMRRAGLAGLPGRKRRRQMHETPFAGDLVDRQFTREAPDQLWVTDITETTREGKIYCAVVLDVHSRRVVGWSIDASQTAALATNALGMAIINRAPQPGAGTVIHSDHGVQFTSWAFTRRAQESGLVPSMGSVGDCYDNAVIESFWGRVQTELLKGVGGGPASSSPTPCSSTSRWGLPRLRLTSTRSGRLSADDAVQSEADGVGGGSAARSVPGLRKLGARGQVVAEWWSTDLTTPVDNNVDSHRRPIRRRQRSAHVVDLWSSATFRSSHRRGHWFDPSIAHQHKHPFSIFEGGCLTPRNDLRDRFGRSVRCQRCSCCPDTDL